MTSNTLDPFVSELWVIDSELIELFPCNIISNLDMSHKSLRII